MPDAMPSPSARDRILDAYEATLIEQGERAATFDTVAKRADVSKGGLLYHFGSKEALVAGFVERLDARREEEIAAIATAQEGVVHSLLRSSLAVGTPFDRSILAAARLAQGDQPVAKAALARLHDSWFEAVAAEVHDPVIARTIVLISDGLYYNSALLPGDSAIAEITAADGGGLTELLALVDDIRRLRRP
ncbi:TetR/AcrR family transcriptional regulator [Microbacteriaceae bacterium VKM Ac-2855]|nr:TetR/AcrR family transcriptional regulator [Microbacteriaceae bacterium VKM Ac-2855]